MFMLRLMMLMFMLFRTMADGDGLDDYYLAGDDGTSEEKARGSSRDEAWLDLSFSRISLKCILNGISIFCVFRRVH